MILRHEDYKDWQSMVDNNPLKQTAPQTTTFPPQLMWGNDAVWRALHDYVYSNNDTDTDTHSDTDSDTTITDTDNDASFADNNKQSTTSPSSTDSTGKNKTI